MVSQKMFIFAVIVTIVAVQDVTAEKFKNGPPPATEMPLMARYIVHNSDWASVSTISVNDSIKGYPFGNVESIADGPKFNGTGIPYMFVTRYDFTIIDLEKDNRCTLLMSLAQGDYCKSKKIDPEDPRCARVMLSGRFEKVQNNSAEEIFARNAMFAKHPAMKHWPADHGWFFAKLNIEQVLIFSTFGGIKEVTRHDYFAADLN